ncbi:DUF839 domain-containing protein [Pseudonocardia kujensis]|nr:alkaline phosphatase PhoX [Pseudonocardia kujensis]MCE0765201.1 DUF839 domain-containing protein [Pseudonocardia kujensis]
MTCGFRAVHGRRRSRTRPTGSAGSSRSTRTTRRPGRSSTPPRAGSSARASPCGCRRDKDAVVHLGDDERFAHVDEFVSSGTLRNAQSRRAREHNLSLLSDGTLSVARFTGGGPQVDGPGTRPRPAVVDIWRFCPGSSRGVVP